jgi:UDP-N-acetylglucosamine--N-acetylmuramyl-(pentapeptide) pyrophosphoryl-undecaprenol N-acetylglucosamine transferase
VSERPRILLAGGGSGGHVFPLLAVAQRLIQALPELEPIFIGTERGLETKLVPAAGHRLELMSALPFRGGGIKGASRGLMSVARALPHARELLRQYQPRAVLSVGGYAAVPISLAARMSGIPLALMEPNAHPGLAQRLVGPGAQRVYTAFDVTKKFFSAAAVLRTGVAIRPGFVPHPYGWSGKGETLRILVLGGSQGARSLNDVVAPALSQVKKLPITIVHQVGKGNLVELRQRYAELKRPGASVIEFIEDMPAAIAAADLVISRAGAGAIAEICAVGRPSILVPLPASGNHQLFNAQSLEKAGGCLCLPARKATAETLAARITDFGREPERLLRMAEQARAWAMPDAAQRVAIDLLELAGLVRSTSTNGVTPALSEPPKTSSVAPASGDA